MPIFKIQSYNGQVKVIELVIVSESKNSFMVKRDSWSNRRVMKFDMNKMRINDTFLQERVMACYLVGYCDDAHLQECIDSIPALIATWVINKKEQMVSIKKAIEIAESSEIIVTRQHYSDIDD